MVMRGPDRNYTLVRDLAGHIINQPVANLQGGRFRDGVRMYNHAAPRNMLDKAPCREWAERSKADPSGQKASSLGRDGDSPADTTQNPNTSELAGAAEISKWGATGLGGRLPAVSQTVSACRYG